MRTLPHADAPRARVVLGGVLVALLVAVAGVTLYLRSPAHALHAPDHALQQLDLFYLDEPAPLADEVGVTPGRVTVVVVCARCAPPAVDADVVTTGDAQIARAYGLMTAQGRVGPGYAIVDVYGRLRYRTFDPAPAAHVDELRVLVDNAR